MKEVGVKMERGVSAQEKRRRKKILSPSRKYSFSDVDACRLLIRETHLGQKGDNRLSDPEDNCHSYTTFIRFIRL